MFNDKYVLDLKKLNREKIVKYFFNFAKRAKYVLLGLLGRVFAELVENWQVYGWLTSSSEKVGELR